MGTDKPNHFVWLDLEMTGLDPSQHVILELAAVVTGPDFVPVESLERVVWQPQAMLDRMEPVVRAMHRDNGLLADVQSRGVSIREAERDLVEMLRRHMAPFQGVLCGNSIHTDRMFLAQQMPMAERYLHYHHLDGTSVRIMLGAHAPSWSAPPPPSGRAHRAMDDIRACLAEMTHFRDRLARAHAAEPRTP